MRHIPKRRDDCDQLIAMPGNAAKVLQEETGSLTYGTILDVWLHSWNGRSSAQLVWPSTLRNHFADKSDKIMDVAAAKLAKRFLAPENRFLLDPQLPRIFIRVLLRVCSQQLSQFLDGIPRGSRCQPTPEHVFNELQLRLKVRMKVD